MVPGVIRLGFDMAGRKNKSRLRGLTRPAGCLRNTRSAGVFYVFLYFLIWYLDMVKTPFSVEGASKGGHSQRWQEAELG